MLSKCDLLQMEPSTPTHCLLEGNCSLCACCFQCMEMALSLCSLWDHMQHVKWINRFFCSVMKYHCVSLCHLFWLASSSFFPPSLISLYFYCLIPHSLLCSLLPLWGNLYPSGSTLLIAGWHAQETRGLMWARGLNSLPSGHLMCTLDMKGSCWRRVVFTWM